MTNGAMMVEIRTLADDEWIQEPGFYAIDIDRHHNQPCLSPESRRAFEEDGVLPPIEEVAVTSGILRMMELSNPGEVWAFHRLNKDRWERKQTDALRLGRAMAAYVEGGMKAVSEHFLVLPEDKPRRPTDDQMKKYQDKRADDLSEYLVLPEKHPKKPTAKDVEAYNYKAAGPAVIERVEYWAAVDKIEKEGKTVLTKKEADALLELKKRVEFWKKVDDDPRDPLTDGETTLIKDMGRALVADPAASAVMEGMPEVTMAYQDEASGLWILSRPDVVSFDGTVIDYKKMNTQGKPFGVHDVDKAIEGRGYHMQMALAAEAYLHLFGEMATAAGIVAQNDAKPHHVILREITEEQLHIGRWQNSVQIARFAECYRSGHWPGPGDDIGPWRPSEAFMNRVKAQMEEAGVGL